MAYIVQTNNGTHPQYPEWIEEGRFESREEAQAYIAEQMGWTDARSRRRLVSTASGSSAPDASPVAPSGRLHHAPMAMKPARKWR